MESFREALERLTRNLVTDLLDAVHAELEQERTAQLKRDVKASAKAPPRRIVRSSSAPPLDDRTVVVRQFDIPVGEPRVRRMRSAGTPRPRRVPAPPQAPAVVKFEVVPHPDRKNRRMVLTRLGTA